MLVTLPDEYCLARKILVTEIENRNLVKFCLKLGLDPIKDHKLIYQLAIGNTSINFLWVYQLRNEIPPMYWFVSKSVDPKTVDCTSFVNKNEKFDNTKPTIGVMLLDKLNKAGLFPKICKEHGDKFTPDFLRQFIYKRKSKEGEKIFRVKPTEKLVTTLSDIIKPDYWYIYPEEVDPALLTKLNLH